MRSMFLRIFVLYFLAASLIQMAIVVSFIRFRPSGVPRFWLMPAEKSLDFYCRIASNRFPREGLASVVEDLELMEKTQGVRTYLLDAQASELRGRNTPSDVTDLAISAMRSDDVQRDASTGVIARRLTGPKKETYVIANQLTRPPFATLAPRIAVPIGILVIAGLFATAVVCYWLARYLTSPLIKLRTATSALAVGDLDIHVDETLTDRRDEIGHLGREFNRMAERLRNLITAQRELLRDVSHELRSPLARLSVALGLARKRAGSNVEESLDRIEREAGSLNELIGHLLTITRLENELDDAPKTDIRLDQLVKDIVVDADFEARGRNRLVREVVGERMTLCGSPRLLRSAIENVIRNAILYTEEGTCVEVALSREIDGDESQALIHVRDHGPGVPEEALGRLFEPFYRVSNARDRETGGAGLGLAITKRAVQLHGGTVKARTASEGGLIVEIRLPVRD
ncbi:MAG: ATP-binding protein [Phycisphaerales bacterium]|nr:ATP-binding protein [Phycisphaerales bacterium]